MRAFYLQWAERLPIFQTLSEKSAASEISQTASGKFVPNSIRQTPSGKSPFTLSWSHYVVLMTIKDPDERSFYEIESRQADWDGAAEVWEFLLPHPLNSPKPLYAKIGLKDSRLSIKIFSVLLTKRSQ